MCFNFSGKFKDVIILEESRTISQIVKNGLCLGCGTCASVCMNNAIHMIVDNRKGVFTPKVDINRCTLCANCYNVCPGHEVDFRNLSDSLSCNEARIDQLIGTYVNIYTGYSTNNTIRFDSSSGGLVTQLLVYSLEQGFINGALVTKMAENDPFKPEPFIARTAEDIINSAGSKYCPVPCNILLRNLLNSNEEDRIAVVGLPCHIHGIRKAEKIYNKLDKKIVLHIGLFCSSSKNFLATQYQLERMSINRNDVVGIKYRGNGWPGELTIILKNNTTRRSPYFSYSDNEFCSFNPQRCSLCIDETAELADISFGDAWCPDFLRTDNLGTSMVVTRNELGEKILHKMVNEGYIMLTSSDIRSIFESQGGLKRKKYFEANRRISKYILGMRTPNYLCNEDLPKSPIYSYLVILLSFPRKLFASHRNLWFLLKIYCKMLNFFSVILSKMLWHFKGHL